MKVLLCQPPGSCCPAVEFAGDEVKIGEEGNLVRLTKEQWNTLVAKIKSVELKELE